MKTPVFASSCSLRRTRHTFYSSCSLWPSRSQLSGHIEFMFIALAVLLAVICGVLLLRCVAPNLFPPYLAWLGGNSLLYKPLLDQDTVINQAPALLLLGPAQTGKSTLFRAACALAGEAGEVAAATHTGPPAPTKGLVRRLLLLPSGTNTSRGALQAGHVVLCDAGGGHRERRQWVELVRDGQAPVGALMFVADARDASDETVGLLGQLAGSKWARSAAIYLALTHFDVLADEQGDASARAICQAREASYRNAMPHGVVLHACRCLSARDPVAACQLLAEAVGCALERAVVREKSEGGSRRRSSRPCITRDATPTDSSGAGGAAPPPAPSSP